MDSAATARWFADPGMIDDPSFQQWEMGSLDQFTGHNIWEGIQQSFSSPSDSYNNNAAGSFNNHPSSGITSNTVSATSKEPSQRTATAAPAASERLKKMPRTSSWSSAAAPNRTSSPRILSFGSPDSPRDDPELYKSLVVSGAVPKEEVAAGCKRSYDGAPKRAATTRPPSNNQDHIIAERKRREKLSQRFIALSAVVPGLKKMDKASVLGDAIKYLKQLQEKVKTLEEQSAQKPAVLVKKSQQIDDDGSCCDENFIRATAIPGDKDQEQDDSNNLPAEIEAKLSEKTVLVKIHCKNVKGLLVKMLAEIESHNLSILNASALQFAISAISVTVLAQVEKGFSLTIEELVKKLITAFRQLV
uniref:BHLH transcription factor n=1 Tax=Dracaena cambodiana TaxID=580341 RepID=A0A3G2C5D5_9ASPA|nr:bHLH transcription factor [Dracaena cambodiana]